MPCYLQPGISFGSVCSNHTGVDLFAVLLDSNRGMEALTQLCGSVRGKLQCRSRRQHFFCYLLVED
jgi:hypothetical protein